MIIKFSQKILLIQRIESDPPVNVFRHTTDHVKLVKASWHCRCIWLKTRGDSMWQEFLELEPFELFA